MKNFEYAQPRTESEALALLAESGKTSVVLAGGTDLIGLMKRSVVSADRVVNIAEVGAFQKIQTDDAGNCWIGAAVHLDECVEHPHTAAFPAISHVVQGISSIQLQCQGTLVGELLRRPNCWYFRNGQGLLANQGRMVVDGDNRYHAILGNRGAAKFVSASRLAPALIALGAKLRVVGPQENDEVFLDVQQLYQTPARDDQMEHVLEKGQLVTHVIIPPVRGRLSAAYEVRHGEGPDQPLAAAAVSLDIVAGKVRQAVVALGQVAPTPWVSLDAAQALVGQTITEEIATQAGMEATAGAMPLAHNEYKIQLAQVAVKRAILRAAGMETGGLEGPFCNQTQSDESKLQPHEKHLVS